MNNCSFGGAKGVSDTYTAALWALDASHWWAARHILGMNYHTGEKYQPDGAITAQTYSAFLHLHGGQGLAIRPESYGYLAFAQGAVGRPLNVGVASTLAPKFTAYAYRADDGSVYLTLINKTFADGAQPISVSFRLPAGVSASGAQQMDLRQKTRRRRRPNGHRARRRADHHAGRLGGTTESRGDRISPNRHRPSSPNLRLYHSFSKLEMIGEMPDARRHLMRVYGCRSAHD